MRRTVAGTDEAAGLVFSDKVDAKTAARQALAEQYGFTPEMEGFFACEVSEDGRTVVFAPVEDSGAGVEGKLGVYTVTLDKGGRATASWSHDGENVGEDMQSPVWDTKLLAAALERKQTGEEWIDIVLRAEQTAQLAKEAAAEVYGLSQAQKDAMEWVEDVYPSPYAMAGDTPVIKIYLWLWADGDSAAFAAGDGVYRVEVNAQTSTIESILYDSTLGNNG